jgi:glycosyltransferase involved in cell wall biosynthesis
MIPLFLKNRDNFDIIHIHDSRSFQGIVAYLFARIRKVPFVFQPHGSYLSPLLGSETKKMARIALDKVIGEGLVKKASQVIVLTCAEAEQYRAMGVPEEKIAIIPNGIDLESYIDLPSRGTFRSKFSANDDDRVILFLGRIHKIKGIDLLVKACAHLFDRFNNLSLAIVGSDDGYLGELKQMLGKMKIIAKNVWLTGPLYGRDKLEAYVDADVFVLPSRYETFPNVVLEAYACSKPVVASDVESISDIVIHGKTGLLFSAGNVDDLESMISRVLTNPEEAEEMGHRARRFVEDEFSIDKVVDSLEALYEKVLEEQAG